LIKKKSSGNQTSCYSKESCKIGTSINIFEHRPHTTQVKVILNNIQSYPLKENCCCKIPRFQILTNLYSSESGITLQPVLSNKKPTEI